MKIVDFFSDKGLVREINEDSYLIDKKNNFAIVSDGMGGHEKGDMASSLVIKEFCKSINEFLQCDISNDIMFQSMLSKYLNNANEDISNKLLRYSKENNIKDTIGATVAGVYIDKSNSKIAIYHLGDSRVYRIRDNNIIQMTIDHNNDSSNKNVLAKAIGNFEVFDLDIKVDDYICGDYYLLCTDGISNFINDEQILDIITNNTKDYCDIIKNNIYLSGAKDNFTLVIIEAE